MRFRQPSPADLPALYRVCLQTGDAGSDATARHDDPDLLGHHWAGPQAVHDPAMREVDEDDAGVVGYLVGVASTSDFEEWCEGEWWPARRERYRLGVERREADAELVRSIHRPDRTPPTITGPFPAHFHVNLQPRTQGQGIGRMLIERLLERLEQRGATGVHLGVDASNARAMGFYRHLGLTEVAVEDDGGLILGQRLG
ncbi:GNAT family N-acetyltransferase [Microcella alkalica]|nr:GNAT family N-acetyltransferase [Microcella alkalica]